MEVYKSTHTSDAFNFALSAVPSIGENGNWFIGEQDTGILASGVDVTGAEVGQIIKVAEVDENGRPTAWEPANLTNGLCKIIDYTTEEETLNSTINTIDITTDINGEAISCKNILIRITGKVINETDNDSHLRIGYSSRDTRHLFGIGCKPLNAAFSAFVLLSVDEQGIVAYQAPNTSGAVASGAMDSNTLVRVNSFDLIRIWSNNYNKTHLAAGANITVWRLD